MLDLTIDIVGSYLFGLVLFAVMFGYFSLAEFLQKWSDAGPQYKKWIRRGGHLTLMFVYSLLIPTRLSSDASCCRARRKWLRTVESGNSRMAPISLELKSLKYYFISYRSVGIYQEAATNRIFQDLFKFVTRNHI